MQWVANLSAPWCEATAECGFDRARSRWRLLTRVWRRALVIAGLSVAGGGVELATAAERATSDVINSAPETIEELTIVGQREATDQLTGAAHYLGPDALEKFNYSDIQRLSRQIPGVSIQVEDGYGLRPNISIRGVATERSGRITLLEDGVLIAPAPYSAPSAYYFPTIGRMHAVEVLKGPAAITQGPYTIGGALNMVSKPIPNQRAGSLLAEAGADHTYRVHAFYGTREPSGFGVLLETHQWRSDGFQDIDGGGDTGLDVRDYTLKLGFDSADHRHSFALKLQRADQDSDQSYLGLTDRDFDRDGLRRYGMSALDNIETKHRQAIFRYRFAPLEQLSFVGVAYRNEHERDWFKSEGIDFDGAVDAQTLNRTSWFNVIQAINRGEPLGDVSVDAMQAVLDGTVDTPANAIQLRSNAREYFSEGVQLTAHWLTQTGALAHDVEAAIRYHRDEEDRLQRNSGYSVRSGRLQLDDLGLLGNAGNRVQSAEAWSLHVYDRIAFGRWVVTPGLRYEDIDQQRIRWEIRNGRTADPASRAIDNLRSTRRNETRVWLPGIGLLYRFSEHWSLFSGVHKGFTAPSNAPGVDEETAVNYELGVRYFGANLRAELIGFYSDYDNLLGECTASSGADCTVGDAFNGDAATVRGIEFSLSGDLTPARRFAMPVTFSYTYIDGEFETDIADTDFFGSVAAGDPIPYLPDVQFNGSIGFEFGPWSAYLSGSYIDAVCVRASCGAFEKTDDSFTVDVSADYQLSDRINVFLRLENLTDAEDIMGRQPYGARPNKDRTAAFGVRVTL